MAASGSSSTSGPFNDPASYDHDGTQSSSSDDESMELPQSKRPANGGTMAALHAEQQMDTLSSATKSPRKRPEPTEGYVYGFLLPFTVDIEDYCVIKIGKTGAGQLGRRLRDHNSEFIKATSIPIALFQDIESLPFSSKTQDDNIVEFVKSLKEKTNIFLLSYVKDGLKAAESGARAALGVAPFNIKPTFKSVFPDSKRVTTTEWVIARVQVIENVQASFWHGGLDMFDTADALLEKFKELNKRKHVTLTISLETLASEIYRNTVKVPQYAPDSKQ